MNNKAFRGLGQPLETVQRKYSIVDTTYFPGYREIADSKVVPVNPEAIESFQLLQS